MKRGRGKWDRLSCARVLLDPWFGVRKEGTTLAWTRGDEALPSVRPQTFNIADGKQTGAECAPVFWPL